MRLSRRSVQIARRFLLIRDWHWRSNRWSGGCGISNIWQGWGVGMNSWASDGIVERSDASQNPVEAVS